MRVLAFDTATRATSVALVDADPADPQVYDVVAHARDDPPAGQRPGHTPRLLGLIADVLSSGGGWPAVDAIAVGVGPGTFTGLRIGVATAHALARARGIPLAGVSTLASLAIAAAPAHADSDAVAAVIDARRREVFAAAWAPGPLCAGRPGPALLVPAPRSPAALADGLSGLGARRVAVGDGAVEFIEVLEASGAIIPDRNSRLHRVDAVHHARLGAAAGPGLGVVVSPEYLRLPDAELSRAAGPQQ